MEEMNWMLYFGTLSDECLENINKQLQWELQERKAKIRRCERCGQILYHNLDCWCRWG